MTASCSSWRSRKNCFQYGLRGFVEPAQCMRVMILARPEGRIFFCYCTTELLAKPVPLTVSTRSPLPAFALSSISPEMLGVLGGCMPLPEPYPPQPKLSVMSNKTDKSFMDCLHELTT